MKAVGFIFFFLLSLLSSLTAHAAVFNPEATNLVVQNAAGEPVELYWLSVNNGEMVLQTAKPIPNTGSVPINSYRTHVFVVTKAGSKLWTEASKFVMSELDEKVFVYKNQTSDELYVIKKNKATDMKEVLAASVLECTVGNYGLFNPQDDGQVECLTERLGQIISRPHKDLKEERLIRKSIGSRLRNYTCADPDMATSTPIHNSTWYYRETGQTYPVSKMFELRGVKIMLIDNFLREEECVQLKLRASPHLTRAAVTGENGEAIISNSRRAYAAMVTPKRNEPDILAELQDRVLAFTNFQTGYGLQAPGQEGFNVIKYNVNDEYIPHCDGSCDGMPHKQGGRIATMVMYCDTAELGGGTTFSNVDVFVNPKAYQATFFSYMDPDGTMDEGAFTEHSGCPILEGEKWIATQWMRKGVDQQNPWSKWDPSGILLEQASQPQQ